MFSSKKFSLTCVLLSVSFYFSSQSTEVQALLRPASWDICVSMGWESDCGYYDLYGSGTEVVNRVVGGPDLADGLWNCAVLGVNGCRAVKLGVLNVLSRRLRLLARRLRLLLRRLRRLLQLLRRLLQLLRRLLRLCHQALQDLLA